MSLPPLRAGIGGLTLGCQPPRARSIAHPLLQLPCQRVGRAEPYPDVEIKPKSVVWRV